MLVLVDPSYVIASIRYKKSVFKILSQNYKYAPLKL